MTFKNDGDAIQIETVTPKSAATPKPATRLRDERRDENVVVVERRDDNVAVDRGASSEPLSTRRNQGMSMAGLPHYSKGNSMMAKSQILFSLSHPSKLPKAICCIYIESSLLKWN